MRFCGLNNSFVALSPSLTGDHDDNSTYPFDE